MKSPVARRLKPFFLVTDIGFIVYWTVTAFHLLPASFLFPDYQNPLVAAWNWSFLPLDLCVSASGFCALFFFARKNAMARPVALISLLLTFCSGLQAVGFWTFRCWFDLTWWLPNLYLLLYPLFFLPALLREMTPETARPEPATP